MKITVFVPLKFLIPWANFPSSFAKDRYHFFLSVTLNRCIYSCATPDILWVTALAYLTCRNCDTNAKFATGFFLKLDLKFELGPPVSTLGGCAGRTIGGGTGISGKMMCGPEGYMWTLR